MAVILKTEHLTRRLEGDIPVTLVDDASVEIKHGEFVAIAGPSGSGKSSLLYLLGLLDKPTSGSIWLDGIDTSTYSDDRLADLRLSQIGFVFQFHFLLPEFTVAENVMLPMRRLGKESKSRMLERTMDLLERVGLSDHAHKVPKQLSGGQSQRVAIARSLANHPKLVLADEPTGNLDTAASAIVRSILNDLARKDNHAVVVVTHEVEFAESTDRIIRIVDGRIVD